MFTIRSSRPTDGARILEIWRGAVDATHFFLSVEDRIAIGQEVCAFLPQAPLTLAVDQDDRPLGFMLIDNGHMEALFIDPTAFGHGIGAALVRHGLVLYPGMTTDVNEQNERAVGFTTEWDSYKPAARRSMGKAGHTPDTPRPRELRNQQTADKHTCGRWLGYQTRHANHPRRRWTGQFRRRWHSHRAR